MQSRFTGTSVDQNKHDKYESSLHADVSYFPLLHAEKGRLCNGIANRVPVSCFFQEFMESALTGCPTVAIVRFNSHWLSSKTLRIIYAV